MIMILLTEQVVKGSCSMLLLTEDGIIAARDAWGRTPIIIGKKEGAMAATSENTAFPNLGYETTYFVGPGEIVRLRADGMEQLRKPNKKMQICSFLWIYYGFPTSSYEGKNVEEVRFETGRVMGETDETEVDCVGGIPDSGIGMAVGYSAGSHIPYQRGISKYTPTWPRSFMPPSQEVRNLVAKMKLIPNKDMLKGKRCLFCDDSIVRGTHAYRLSAADLCVSLHRLHLFEESVRADHPPDHQGIGGRREQESGEVRPDRFARISAHGGGNPPTTEPHDPQITHSTASGAFHTNLSQFQR